MIRFIRSLLCAFCFIVFGAGSLLIGFILFPTMLLVCKSENQRHAFANTIHITWRFFVWLMCSLRLIRVNCPDQKKLKSLRGTIVIANHPSLIDVVILVSRIPNAVCVVKESLFKNIFVRRVIQKTYLSNTMDPDEFIAKGSDILSKGYNIIIFPEGTRTVSNRPIHLHRGFAYLQLASNANILPIKITNNPPILGKMQKWWDIGNKTSVYDIVPMPYIAGDAQEKGNNRTAAIKITAMAKATLFGA